VLQRTFHRQQKARTTLRAFPFPRESLDLRPRLP
jgi:hypothetical protein